MKHSLRIPAMRLKPKLRVLDIILYPMASMYGRFTYINQKKTHANVGKYIIHGASGYITFSTTRSKKTAQPSHAPFPTCVEGPILRHMGILLLFQGTEVQAGRPDSHLAHPMRLLVLEILYKSIDYIVIHASCVIYSKYIYI